MMGWLVWPWSNNTHGLLVALPQQGNFRPPDVALNSIREACLHFPSLPCISHALTMSVFEPARPSPNHNKRSLLPLLFSLTSADGLYCVPPNRPTLLTSTSPAL